MGRGGPLRLSLLFFFFFRSNGTKNFSFAEGNPPSPPINRKSFMVLEPLLFFPPFLPFFSDSMAVTFFLPNKTFSSVHGELASLSLLF